MTQKKPVRSESYIKARKKLPENLLKVLDEFIEDYKYAAFKHHGHAFVSPMVLAELISIGWRPTKK